MENVQSQEGVMGHWDHPVGIVLLREAGNWLVDKVCREREREKEREKGVMESLA
jgi:hypothetical protein